jgi:hypothetical protein
MLINSQAKNDQLPASIGGVVMLRPFDVVNSKHIFWKEIRLSGGFINQANWSSPGLNGEGAAAICSVGLPKVKYRILNGKSA